MKTVRKKKFRKKLIENLLRFLILSHRLLLCFQFFCSRNVTDEGNIKFPEKNTYSDIEETMIAS